MNSSISIAMSPLIERVTKNGFCTGCGLCAAIAAPSSIEMRLSSEGYLRPNVLIPISPEATAQISEVCPGVKVVQTADAANSNLLWGPLLATHTGHAIDPKVRLQGSSGGVITALLTHLLSTRMVDFVVQIAASSTEPLKNSLQISHSAEDVLRAAGSRYAPSAPLVQLRELLATGKKFAFVGKPCDVAALRRYVNLNASFKPQIPYMLSFMCAGIPSANGTLEVVKKLGAIPERVIDFRYRGDGWPGMTRAIQDDGKSFEMDYSTSWGTILNRHLQFRCKICPDGTGEFADVVCADAWYGKDGYPDFAERDGRSLVLVRTITGQQLIRDAKLSNSITLADLDPGEISKMQPYQVERKQMVLGRSIATRLAAGVAPTYIGLRLFRASLKASPWAWLRSAVGTFRRTKEEIQ